MRLTDFIGKYHVFILLGSLAALFAGALISPETAQAFASYLSAALTKYPQISGSRLDGCLLCHTTGTNPGALNTYGTAYKNNGRNFDAIANLDSDGDGVTNIAEINALTFPGNRADFPQATATVLPTATAVPPTATPSPTRVTSPTATPKPLVCNPSPCQQVFLPLMLKGVTVNPVSQTTVAPTITPTLSDHQEEDDDDDDNSLTPF